MSGVRKYLNYILFGLVVLAVVFLAINRSQHLRGLVNGLTSSDPQAQKTAAAELIKEEQFMDSITGEPDATRAKAAEALEQLGNADAVKQLLNLLKDQEKSVRERAVVALEKIGANSPENLKEFVAGLKDGDGNVRKGVITALTTSEGGIGPKPGVVKAIVDLMKAEGGARGPGGDVLGSPLFLKGGAATEAVPLLIAQLKDKDEGVRGGATDALGKIGDRSAIPALKEAMHSDTPQVRRIAIGAIALIADPSGEDALIEALANPDDDNDARAQAAAGLGKIANQTAIASLVKALDDDDNKLRTATVAALARAGRPTPDAKVNPEVLTALTTALRDDRDTVRLGAAQALQVIAAPEANDALIAATHKDDPDLRQAAVTALGFADNAAAVPTLIQMLKDPDGTVSAAAADALGKIGKSADDALIALLQQGGTDAYYAAQAIAQHGADVLPALEKVASASNPVGQRWAAVALGGTGLSEARPTLQQLAQSTDPDVAYVANEQLNRLGRTQ